MEKQERTRAELNVRLVSYLQKIPLFEDITPSTTRKILGICTKINLKEGQILCEQGSPSYSMYILLYGKLEVTVGDSNPIATIEPVSCIGEMGVFTAEPRSANVRSVTNSGLLTIRASDLNSLIRKEPEFGVKIMSKVIKILAERLKADNVKINEIEKNDASAEAVPVKKSMVEDAIRNAFK